MFQSKFAGRSFRNLASQRNTRSKINSKLSVEQLENRALMAADFELIKDINTVPGTELQILSSIFSPATAFHTVGPVAYFAGSNTASGTELWKTDGTQEGTSMVKDINPGGVSSFNMESSSPRHFVNLGRTVYFFSTTEARGESLWKSDGTEEGTTLVYDISPNTRQSRVSQPIIHEGSIYFIASDGEINGLYKSDGTTEGTTRVRAFRTDNSGTFERKLGPVVMDGTLYFFAKTRRAQTSGLWKSDGTSEGTTLVRAIRTPNELTSVGSKLFFSARNGGSTALWTSDGTRAGTQPIASQARSLNPLNLTNANGTLFFNGAGNLMTSDGTAAGTIVLKANNLSSITAVGSKVYFRPYDAAVGYELWSSNGTVQGTKLVKDINPGAGHANIGPITNVGNTVYFSAHNNGQGQYQLWKSDGTESGTEMVKEINPNTGTNLNPVTVIGRLNGEVYFSANDGQGNTLWKSNGTSAGTVKVDEGGVTGDAHPYGFATVGNVAYFSAKVSSTDFRLFKTDGTNAGTVEIKDLYDPPSQTQYAILGMPTAVMGGEYYFIEPQAVGSALWKTDGTAAGTVLVKTLGTYQGFSDQILVIGNKLFFAMDDGVNGRELWVSDGTEAGTRLVKDINPGPTGSNTSGQMVAFKGKAYFRAYSAGRGDELWSSDGTDAGTKLVKEIYPGPAGANIGYSLAELDGFLYFGALSGAERGIWRTNGTRAGTTRVIAQYSQFLSTDGNYIYFGAQGDTSSTFKLMRTDGTSSGTIPLGQFVSNGSFQYFSTLNVNGKAMFVADDGIHGNELWTTDGTPEGTKVIDLLRGRLSSNPKNLSVREGVMYFTAFDGEREQYWTSDGTVEGTVTLELSNPESAPSIAFAYGQLNGRMVFWGYTTEAGFELYALNETSGLQTIEMPTVASTPTPTAKSSIDPRSLRKSASLKASSVDAALLDVLAVSNG
jgi:ELWxxDGT repeat protein